MKKKRPCFENLKLSEGIKLVYGFALMCLAIPFYFYHWPNVSSHKGSALHSEDKMHASVDSVANSNWDEYCYFFANTNSFSELLLIIAPQRKRDSLFFECKLIFPPDSVQRLAVNLPGKINHIRYYSSTFEVGKDLPTQIPKNIDSSFSRSEWQTPYLDFALDIENLDGNFDGELRFDWYCPLFTTANLYSTIYFPMLDFPDGLAKEFSSQIQIFGLAFPEESDREIKWDNQEADDRSNQGLGKIKVYTNVYKRNYPALRLLLVNSDEEFASQESVVWSSFMVSAALSAFVAGFGLFVQGLEFFFRKVWEYLKKQYRKWFPRNAEEKKIVQSNSKGAKRLRRMRYRQNQF